MTQTMYLGRLKAYPGELTNDTRQKNSQHTSRLNDLHSFQDVTFVIPTMNEEKNLLHVLPLIPAEAEIIIIDGHSIDKTIDVAKSLRPDARVFVQSGRGKGNAMRYGFRQATRDIVITYDADGSFSPTEIAHFVSPLREGYDMVKGSRFMFGGGTQDMPRMRRIGNRVFTILTNMCFGTHYTDLAYGFHAFRRSILEKVDLTSDGFEIDTEMYIKAKKANLKTLEVPSVEKPRVHGQGKLKSVPDGYRILKTIFRERVYSWKAAT